MRSNPPIHRPTPRPSTQAGDDPATVPVTPSQAPTGPTSWATASTACGYEVIRFAYGYPASGTRASGARARQSGFSSAAATRNTPSATAAPIHAVFTLTAPVTSSRLAVRGLRASMPRSMTRLAAIAKVRAPTIATVMMSRSHQRMRPPSIVIAVSAAR